MTPTDAPRLAELLADPEVTRHLGDGQPWPGPRVDAWIERSVCSFAASGIGVFVVELASTGAVVGWCSLEPGEDTGEIELSYAIDRGVWGSGIGSEAARAVLGYADQRLDRVLATVDPANRASLRILEGLGFTVTGSRPDVHGLPTVFLYRAAPLDRRPGTSEVEPPA